MRTLLLTTVAFALGARTSLLQAQAPASPARGPAFEVASVKPNKSGDQRVMIRAEPGGQYTATNVTLQMLIQSSYRVQNFQIVGAPSWTASDRFNIVAKAGAEESPVRAAGIDQGGPIQLMVQALLADRFKLAARSETRELPVFALVMARSDGRLGPQLHKSDVDCAARFAPGAPPPPLSKPGERPVCGMYYPPGRVLAGAIEISQLATVLSGRLNRVVVDQTGLSGVFDLDLQWTPDLNQGAGALGPLPVRPDADAQPATESASVFTAIQEQLGLKLDARRRPVEVLVIDHVEQPTPD